MYDSKKELQFPFSKYCAFFLNLLYIIIVLLYFRLGQFRNHQISNDIGQRFHYQKSDCRFLSILSWFHSEIIQENFRKLITIFRDLPYEYQYSCFILLNKVQFGMKNEMPLSSIEINSFCQIYKLISKKTIRVIENASKWAKIELQVSKKSAEDGVYICDQCGNCYKRVHQRSAHMNKHANDRKKEAKKRQLGLNDTEKATVPSKIQKRRLIRKAQKKEKEKKLRGRRPKKPEAEKAKIESKENEQQLYEQKESYLDS